ncbi:L-aspartate oxidase [Nibribacter koreensis]|uniref:L-aspartate oxidase n=1 Tax=Nibribacter koreensis TaxID=1084519 RepID=A0ABP8FI32_9BACT
MKEVDVLVIGSGIAGLSYALKVADLLPTCKILVVAKASELETNTSYAQGGIAAVLNLLTDSYQKHVQDTMEAGAWLSNLAVAEAVVQEAPARIADLMDWGVAFDTTPSGAFHLGREGGHSENRILHCKDQTGYSLEKALSQQVLLRPNIEVLSHHFAVDLITFNQGEAGPSCHGALLLDLGNQQLVKVLSRITMLATGGAGQVYQATTNPVIATGDGVAMAHRAGATVEHLEFVQFHPTALYHPGEKPSFLVSEAVRGFGGILRNAAGEAFMVRYDSRGCLAPRDIVARAIEAEMKKEQAVCMFLDVTHLDSDDFAAHFPTIYQKCLSIGVDPARQCIPVVPAAHYFCGGVTTDAWGRTSIQHLYASGECACTGLHGANRLASNSLQEALVFAHRSSADTCAKLEDTTLLDPIPAWQAPMVRSQPENLSQISRIREKIQAMMSQGAGIVRCIEELTELHQKLSQLAIEVEAMVRKYGASLELGELNNLRTVAQLVTDAALSRKESIGLHYLAPDPVPLQAIDRIAIV